MDAVLELRVARRILAELEAASAAAGPDPDARAPNRRALVGWAIDSDLSY